MQKSDSQRLYGRPGASRRDALRWLGGIGAASAASLLGHEALGQTAPAPPASAGPALNPLTEQPGPEPSPYWNALGALVIEPQKAPLIQLTDRPIQLETPRLHFQTELTPNAAFFVRWHLAMHPRAVDLSTFRLRIEGHVERAREYAFAELLKAFKPVTVVAVNQCAGNSRSRFSPRVPGVQWGNGAMGCAQWTGVRVRDLLAAAGMRAGAKRVQFEGLDRAPGDTGPSGFAAYRKSLPLGDGLDDALIAYAMNGEPLPLLNGFPLRLVVPGWFGTYWVKALAVVRVADPAEASDPSYWMARAYQIPARPGQPPGHVPPAEAQRPYPKIPLGRMPVRSFLISPDGTSKLPAGLPVTLRGIAFSGAGRITRVEVSTDDKSWAPAALAPELGRYAFRAWSFRFTPARPGKATLAVRATDERGAVQGDAVLWNPSGYLWNRIERQEVMIGTV